ncbi:Disease resistance protein RPM1 [Hordeum vulgare]|nr:Disease resistance protein RPM1 [Hordeum vulgare]
MRLGLGTFDIADDVACAYGTATWRLNKPGREMNFPECRLSIAEMDEHAMAEWRRQFLQDVLDEREFFAQREACPREPSLRPVEDFIIVHASAEMQVEPALLSTNGAVAWLDHARQDVSCRQVADELATALGALKVDVEVVTHYPEQFFVRFMHQHHCTLAVSLGHLPEAVHTIFVTEWRLEAHADNEDQLDHVRLYLEGVPLHGGTTTLPHSSSTGAAPLTTSSCARCGRRTRGTWRLRGQPTPMPSPRSMAHPVDAWSSPPWAVWAPALRHHPP